LFFKPGKNFRGRARQTIFELLKLPIYCPQPSSICSKIINVYLAYGGWSWIEALGTT